MAKKPRSLNVVEEMALSQLLGRPKDYAPPPEPPAGTWVRIVRSYLRMTQAELAKRAKVTQPHLVAIERGKIDPQAATLHTIFPPMGSHLLVPPEPRQQHEESLPARP